MPERFTLASQFIKPDAEQSLVAALAATPDVYWQVLDLLHPDALVHAKNAYTDVAEAIASGRPAPLVEGTPAADPIAVARELADLHQKRLLADMTQGFLERLRGESTAADLISMLETALVGVQHVVNEARAEQLMTMADTMPGVLVELAERRQAVKEGRTVGIPAGFPALDKLLGGLQTGLHIVAAEPNAGKTTFCLQVAANAAKAGYPVLFVTFEESPDRLLLKTLCQAAGLEIKRYQDGYGETADLHKALATFGAQFRTLHLLEGTPQTTVERVKAKALQLMAKTKADRCLIVIDYLQTWAAAARRDGTDFRLAVSDMVADLRAMAKRLNSPVLAISSQNRQGQGEAKLSSFKESGEVEYTADSAWFLVNSERRKATGPILAIDLVVAKNRFGEKNKTIDLVFRPSVGAFSEEAKR